MIIKHKFHAQPTTIDDIKFSSKAEAKRYQQLMLLIKAGEVLFFLLQVPFILPGGVKYFCDFQIFWANGEVTFEDVKGMRLPMYILKKKQVEALYPIKIIEV